MDIWVDNDNMTELQRSDIRLMNHRIKELNSRLEDCETLLRMMVEKYFVTDKKHKVYAITSKADAEAFNYLAVNGFIKTVNADCDFYFLDNRGKNR